MWFDLWRRRIDVHYAMVRGRCIPIPEPVVPRTQRHVLTIAAIIRDEFSYLVEWIEFHAMMGCTHFYIYDNNSRDAPETVLKPYMDAGLVTLIPWASFYKFRRRLDQNLAYAHAIGNFGPLTRWMAFIDIDEFIFPVREPSLVDLLQAYDDLPSLSAYWFMFGSSGHETRPDGLVVENYTARAPFPPPAVKHLVKIKSIVKPAAVRAVYGAHMQVLENGVRESWNEKRQHMLGDYENPGLCTGDVIRVNHYFTKSKQELAARRPTAVGGGVRAGIRPNDDVIAVIDEQAVEDRDIQRFLPELKARVAARSQGGDPISWR